MSSLLSRGKSFLGGAGSDQKSSHGQLSDSKKKCKERLKNLIKNAYYDSLTEDQAAGKITSIPKWTDDSEVSIVRFLDKVSSAITAENLEVLPKDRPKIFSVNGKRLQFFQDAFFLSTDGTISWNNFKKKVLYVYEDRQLALSKVLDKELVASKKLAEISKRFGEGDIEHETLQQLIRKTKAFPEEHVFWTLDCWAEDKAHSTTKFADWAGKYTQGGLSVDDVQSLQDQLRNDTLDQPSTKIHFFQEEYTAALVLVVPTSSTDLPIEGRSKSISTTDEKHTRTEEDAAAATSPAPASSSASASSLSSAPAAATASSAAPATVESLQSQRIDLLISLVGLPLLIEAVKILSQKVKVLSGDSFGILSESLQRANESSEQGRGILKQLLLSLENGFEIRIRDAKQAAQKSTHALASHNASKKKKDVADGASLSQEKIKSDELVEVLSRERALIRQHVVDVHRRALTGQRHTAKAGAKCKSRESPDGEVKLNLETSAPFDADSIYFQRLCRHDSTEFPACLDYSSQLHPVDQAKSTPYLGVHFALRAAKEWQEFANIHSLERISIEYLARNTSNTQQALERLKLEGTLPESLAKRFGSLLSKSPEEVTAAALEASDFRIDDYLRVDNVDDLRLSMFKYGPALVTLPVRDPTSPKFWVGKSSDLYHTVLAVGYDSIRRTVLLRNSWGIEFGTFGHVEISFDSLFQPQHYVTMLVDGPSKRKAEVVEIESIAALHRKPETPQEEQINKLRRKVDKLKSKSRKSKSSL